MACSKQICPEIDGPMGHVYYVNPDCDMTPGRKVRRYTKNGKKKVWFFRPIDVFNLGFFRSDDLVIWTVCGILAWKNIHFS